MGRRAQYTGDIMPEFTIKAKDVLGPDAVAAYGELCEQAGFLHTRNEVVKALEEFHDWQTNHRPLVKAPDHKHVSAGSLEPAAEDEIHVQHWHEGSGEFLQDLRSLINSHSKENGSNSPDYILACYLDACLNVFNTAVKQRDAWFGVKLQPGKPTTRVKRNRVVVEDESVKYIEPQQLTPDGPTHGGYTFTTFEDAAVKEGGV